MSTEETGDTIVILYALSAYGWRTLDPEEPTLFDGEVLSKSVPQSLVDTVTKAEEEAVWRASEMSTISTQISKLQDDDPSSLPGTEQEWRAYRIKVRAWSADVAGYPDSEFRPARP